MVLVTVSKESALAEAGNCALTSPYYLRVIEELWLMLVRTLYVTIGILRFITKLAQKLGTCA